MTSVKKQHIVTERGVREQGRHHPHSIKFSAMISVIKAFMGLEQIIYKSDDGWVQDDDYKFQLGVSGEGFGLRYNMNDILEDGRWGDQPIYDCLSAEGIKFRLVKDKGENIHDEIIKHLTSDLPILVLKKSTTRMLIGYDNYGESLLVYCGHVCCDGTLIKEKSVLVDKNYIKDSTTFIFIDGISEPSNRKEVMLRALQRGYEMLSEMQKLSGSFGYGRQMYTKWISRLNDNAKYQSELNKLKPTSIIFDLAERRCYTSTLFIQCETFFGENSFKDAIDAFRSIHDRMWEIHRLMKGEMNNRTDELNIRDKVVEILKDCQTLDQKAAENIRAVLDKNNII